MTDDGGGCIGSPKRSAPNRSTAGGPFVEPIDARVADSARDAA
jgi:hypothetical protein